MAKLHFWLAPAVLIVPVFDQRQSDSSLVSLPRLKFHSFSWSSFFKVRQLYLSRKG